jgi:hypothetical protein
MRLISSLTLIEQVPWLNKTLLPLLVPPMDAPVHIHQPLDYSDTKQHA